MSANNQNLSEYFTCEICNKYYLNPIILPCGDNVCEEHVKQKTKITDNQEKEYQCELCQSKHKLPTVGFIINKSFIQMMNKNLHLNEKTKTAIKKIDDLDSLNKEIDLIVKDPEHFIFNYFSEEKNKIDLKRETLFANINDISEEMINEIKKLEIESKSNLTEKKQNLIDSNKF
jgi:hypothetical protein